MNIGAILLGYVVVIVLGLTSLGAFGLQIAQKHKGARLSFATGLLGAAVIAALAALSFLQKGQGLGHEGHEPMFLLTALSLLMAGAGQFVAALRMPRAYASALGCAVGSISLHAVSVLGTAVPGVNQVLGVRSLSLPGVHLGLALSLLLAVLSLMIATVPPRRGGVTLLWTTLAALGGIAGFAIGDACVTTGCKLMESFPGGGPQRVRVVVDVLGVRVSDETGLAPIPREGFSLVRVVSLAQAAWVYGPLAGGTAAGSAVGIVAAWGVARWLSGNQKEHLTP